VARNLKERRANSGIVPKSLRSADQPEIEFIFESAQIRNQFRRIAFRIIHQVTRMNFEKLREQHAAGVRQMRPRAAFNLREVRLRKWLLQVLLYGPDHFPLRHGAVEAAHCAFDFAKIPDFVAEQHIAIRDQCIAMCDGLQ
jgi:hypothetical protein